MPKALRHQHHAAAQSFEVLSTNPDGTINLGDTEGKLVIGNCLVSDMPKPGYATLVTEPESELETEAELEPEPEPQPLKPAVKGMKPKVAPPTEETAE